MGKKITASINNQKIEVKNQRNGNNKITDQIIGKNKKHLASN